MQGGSTCAVLAYKCPQITVTAVDTNLGRVTAWNSDSLPISEPELQGVVKIVRGQNLWFTTNLTECVEKADLVILCVDTPIKPRHWSVKRSLDTSQLHTIAVQIAKTATSNKIIVEKSTVPVGTGEMLRSVLQSHAQESVSFEVLSNPEFMVEGSAISDLLKPDRVLIGSSQSRQGLAAAELLADVYANWVPRDRILKTNLWSSELSKLASNAMLAQRISSINALSMICEKTGATIGEIAGAVGADSRLGHHMLKSSFGFGGSCLKKDVQELVYLCEALGLDTVANYWQSILEINELQTSNAVERICSLVPSNLWRSKICILGFAFKPGTTDTRESCAIPLIKGILEREVSVSVYDPAISARQISHQLSTLDIANSRSLSVVQVCPTAVEACTDAHAVIIVTEWPNFQTQPLQEYSHFGLSSKPNKDAETTYQRSIPLDQNATHERVNTLNELHNEECDVSLPSLESTDCDCNRLVNRAEAFDVVNWRAIAGVMQSPKVVFGTDQFLNTPWLQEIGFQVERIGAR